MRKLLYLLIAAALCVPVGAQAWWKSIQQVAVSGAAPAGLALDANQVSQGTTSSITVTFSTTAPNEIVLVLIAGSGTTVSSVSGSSLGAMTLRASANRFSSQFAYSYYKVAASQLTNEVMTVNLGASGALWFVNVISIKGANTSTPFDPNAALPFIIGMGGAGGHYATATTTNSNTFIFGVTEFDSTSNPTAGSGWTLLQSASGTGTTLTEYQIVSSPQSALALTSGTGASGDVDAAIADAITQ